jgi:hypothetical protein
MSDVKVHVTRRAAALTLIEGVLSDGACCRERQETNYRMEPS